MADLTGIHSIKGRQTQREDLLAGRIRGGECGCAQWSYPLEQPLGQPLVGNSEFESKACIVTNSYDTDAVAPYSSLSNETLHEKVIHSHRHVARCDSIRYELGRFCVRELGGRRPATTTTMLRHYDEGNCSTKAHSTRRTSNALAALGPCAAPLLSKVPPRLFRADNRCAR